MPNGSSGVEDQHLINGVSRGLPDDLEELYRRYAALLKSVIMQVLHDEAEASEILQDVFCQVWERANHYSASKGKLARWLCTLARRRAIDRLRQQSAYRCATKRYELPVDTLEILSTDCTLSSAKSSKMTSAPCCARIWLLYPPNSARLFVSPSLSKGASVRFPGSRTFPWERSRPESNSV